MRFRSPQRSNEPVSGTVKSTRARKSSSRGAPCGQPWVLLGEDDADMRELLCHVLEANGYRVTMAEDGQRLSSEINELMNGHGQKRYPDLVVSDVRMPKLSGLAVLRSLRSAGWGIPVIIITAFPDRETERAVRHLDAELLPKPFAVGELVSKVREILSRREG